MRQWERGRVKSAPFKETLCLATFASLADDTLTEVVVTARRVEERAQDVPISISVFNQQQISNLNVVTASDLAAYTPSLSVTNTFGAVQASDNAHQGKHPCASLDGNCSGD